MSAERALALAGRLRAAGVEFTVIGGTARWLAGARDAEPLDLDIEVLPAGVDDLVQALTMVGVVASPDRLRRTAAPVRFSTPWGPLDVFVRDGLA